MDTILQVVLIILLVFALSGLVMWFKKTNNKPMLDKINSVASILKPLIILINKEYDYTYEDEISTIIECVTESIRLITFNMQVAEVTDLFNLTVDMTLDMLREADMVVDEDVETIVKLITNVIVAYIS